MKMSNLLKLALLLLVLSCSFSDGSGDGAGDYRDKFETKSSGTLIINVVDRYINKNLTIGLNQVDVREHANQGTLTLDFTSVEGLEISFPKTVKISENGVRSWLVTRNDQVELPRPRKFVNYEGIEFYTFEDISSTLNGLREANLVINDQLNGGDLIVIKLQDVPRNIKPELSSTEEAFKSNSKLPHIYHKFDERGEDWYLIDVIKILNSEKEQITLRIDKYQSLVKAKKIDTQGKLKTNENCWYSQTLSDSVKQLNSLSIRLAKLDGSAMRDFKDQFLLDNYTSVINPGETGYYGFYVNYDIGTEVVPHRPELKLINAASACSIKCNMQKGSFYGHQRNPVDFKQGVVKRKFEFDLKSRRINFYYSKDSIKSAFGSSVGIPGLGVLDKQVEFIPSVTITNPIGRIFIGQSYKGTWCHASGNEGPGNRDLLSGSSDD